MKKQNFIRKAAALVLAGVMVTGGAMPTFAAGWFYDGNGWRYGTNADNSIWLSSCWKYIDSDNDGIAECYSFDLNGYKQADRDIPDGSTVNADGAWTVDGVIQTRPSFDQAGGLSADLYNEQGASLVALEMVENTREENVKYGEVGAFGEGTNIVAVSYANGFIVEYRTGNPGDRTLYAKDGKLVFEYYDCSLTSAGEIESYLYRLGAGFKGGNGGTHKDELGCWIKFKDGHFMYWDGCGLVKLVPAS